MVHNAIMLVKNQLMLDHHVFIFGLNQLLGRNMSVKGWSQMVFSLVLDIFLLMLVLDHII